MNLKENLRHYTKTADLYYEWAGDNLKKLQTKFALQVPEGVESTLPEIDSSTIKSYGNVLLDSNHRILFDFFDAMEIWIVIDYDRKDSPEWFHKICGETSAYFATRIETEMAAFTKGFALLEQKVNYEEDSRENL